MTATVAPATQRARFIVNRNPEYWNTTWLWVVVLRTPGQPPRIIQKFKTMKAAMTFADWNNEDLDEAEAEAAL